MAGRDCDKILSGHLKSDGQVSCEMDWEALEGLEEYERRSAARREERLWKEVDIPCSLSDLIGGLTKEEMSNIRRSYNLKRLSALNKSDLAAKLVELVPGKFAEALHNLDQGRYSLLKAMAKNSGVLEGVDLEAAQAEALRNSCLVFPGICHDEKVLYMPSELAVIFNRTDGVALKRVVKRNTEWITLTHGMLHYYGVMGMGTLVKKIEELTGEKVDYLDYIRVITPAMDFYEQVQYTFRGLCDCRVDDAEEIFDEQRSRQNFDHYPFTKEQLLAAGITGYVDKTAAMDDFLKLLAENYDLSQGEIEKIALQLVCLVNNGGKPGKILSYLESRLEFPSFEFVQLLTAKIVEVHNNTRQWVLKGHTPNELFQEEKKFLKPLPAEPLLPEQAGPAIYDYETRKKVGRNDPCPCGSGKKFKRCCGR